MDLPQCANLWNAEHVLLLIFDSSQALLLAFKLSILGKLLDIQNCVLKGFKTSACVQATMQRRVGIFSTEK